MDAQQKIAHHVNAVQRSLMCSRDVCAAGNSKSYSALCVEGIPQGQTLRISEGVSKRPRFDLDELIFDLNTASSSYSTAPASPLAGRDLLQTT